MAIRVQQWESSNEMRTQQQMGSNRKAAREIVVTRQGNWKAAMRVW